MFRKDLSRGAYIAYGIIMLVCYICGVPMLIVSLTDGFVLMMFVVALLMCGAPFGMTFFKKGKQMEDEEDVAVYEVGDNYVYRRGGWKKFALFFIGCAVGIVLTPINIVYYFYRAARISKLMKEYEEQEKARAAKLRFGIVDEKTEKQKAVSATAASHEATNNAGNVTQHKSLTCPKCKGSVLVIEGQQILSCSNCGQTYKNPYYN